MLRPRSVARARAPALSPGFPPWRAATPGRSRSLPGHRSIRHTARDSYCDGRSSKSLPFYFMNDSVYFGDFVVLTRFGEGSYVKRLVVLCLSVALVTLWASPLRSASAAQLVTNGGFESGSTGWQQSSANGYPLVDSSLPHSGAYSAWLCGYNA